MNPTISGCLLAGGKSKRFGTDKALLLLKNQPIIAHLYQLLTSVYQEVFIIANEPSKYQFLGAKVFTDIHQNIGPLGGIHSALTHATNDEVFILSCDLPLITRDFIRFVSDYPIRQPIILPKTAGVIQPLCGIYNKSCLKIIAEMIGLEPLIEDPEKPKQWKYSPLILIEKAHTQFIHVETEYSLFDKKIFLNINHPSDFEKIQILNKS